jgi:protein SCO1/2
MKACFIGVVLALAALGSPRATHTNSYRGGIVTPPLAKPQFVLTDTSGAPFDFRKRTAGSVTLLFFGYINCPAECPAHMSNIGRALKALPPDVREHVKLVFVSTDPARDTPAKLRRWLDAFDTHFIGLTGTESAVAAAEKAAGIPLAYKTGGGTGVYSVSHASFVLAYTTDNRAHLVYPGGVSQQDWIHDLPLLMKESW